MDISESSYYKSCILYLLVFGVEAVSGIIGASWSWSINLFTRWTLVYATHDII